MPASEVQSPANVSQVLVTLGKGEACLLVSLFLFLAIVIDNT